MQNEGSFNSGQVKNLTDLQRARMDTKSVLAAAANEYQDYNIDQYKIKIRFAKHSLMKDKMKVLESAQINKRNDSFGFQLNNQNNKTIDYISNQERSVKRVKQLDLSTISQKSIIQDNKKLFDNSRDNSLLRLRPLPQQLSPIKKPTAESQTMSVERQANDNKDIHQQLLVGEQRSMNEDNPYYQNIFHITDRRRATHSQLYHYNESKLRSNSVQKYIIKGASSRGQDKSRNTSPTRLELLQSYQQTSRSKLPQTSKLNSIKDLRKVTQADFWSEERKPAFPIQKTEMRQNMPTYDGNILTAKIDQVIEKPLTKYYGFQHAQINNIENDINFRRKLQMIDDVVNQNLFKETYNVIMPHFYDQKETSQIGKSGKQLMVVHHQFKTDLIDNDKKILFDHRGNVLTKSGSQLQGISDYLEKTSRSPVKKNVSPPPAAVASKEKEILQGKKSKMSLKLHRKKTSMMQDDYKLVTREDIDDDDDDLAVSDESNDKMTDYHLNRTQEWEQISRQPSLMKHKSTDKQQVINRMSPLKQKSNAGINESIINIFNKSQLDSLSQNKKKSKKFSFKDEKIINDIINKRKEEAKKNALQEEYLCAYNEFDTQLKKKLDSDSENDEEYNDKKDDENMENMFYQSDYFNKMKELESKEEQNKRKMFQIALQLGDQNMGTKLTEHALNKMAKQHMGMEQSIKQIDEKLEFMQDIQKAQDMVKNRVIVKMKRNNVLLKHQMDESQIEELVEEQMLEYEVMKLKRNNVFDEDPAYENMKKAVKQFVIECTANNVIPPAIYKGVQENRIKFMNLNLQRGLCKALARSIKEAIPVPLEVLVFQNNNLNDECFGLILEALQDTQGIKGLFSVKNQVGPISMGHIIRKVMQPSEKPLQELVFNGSQIKPALMADLLGSIKDNNQLTKFGLSQQKIDSKASVSLTHLIKNSQALKKLDLSNCQFLRQQGLIDILKPCVAKNTLQYLNLSFNSVNQEFKQEYSIVLKLLIEQSKFLVHLNLSLCGLSSQQAIDVFKSVRKSKTLQCLHFSGNYLKPETLKEIRQILKIKIHNQDESIQNQEVHDHQQQTHPTIGIHTDITINSIRDKNQFQKKGHLQKQYKHQGYNKISEWKESKNCWICGNWQYVLAIWSPLTGSYLYQQKHLRDLDPEYSRSLLEVNPNINLNNINYDTPAIYGHATGFKIEQMQTIQEFINRLQMNQKVYLRYVTSQAEEKERLEKLKQEKLEAFNNLKQLRQQVKGTPREIYVQAASEDTKNVIQFNREWPALMARYTSLFENQQINSIDQIVNAKFRPEERYYVWANYIPPGCSSILVQPSKTAPVSIKEFDINPREADVATLFKKVKKLKHERQFNLKDSIFSAWNFDLKERYRKMFEADMKFSKIKKFVKDPAILMELSNVILENYGRIYEIYLHTNGKSNYPSIMWLAFTNACQEWKCLDSNLTMTTIDRLFYSVNFDGAPGGGLEDNPENELCRYEFFEIVVRMAQAKYPSINIANALERLLNECIYPNSSALSWFGFRQELIWTLEVDDLLKANKDSIRKIYQSVFKGLKKSFDVEDSLALTQKAKLGLLEGESTIALAYSKFLIIDEMENAEQMAQLSLVEFFEYFPRLAQIKYKDSTQTLFDKCFQILCDIFKLFGLTPQRPIQIDFADSESDYDDDIFEEQ